MTLNLGNKWTTFVTTDCLFSDIVRRLSVKRHLFLFVITNMFLNLTSL